MATATPAHVDVQAIVDHADQLDPQPVDRVTAAVNELVDALLAVGETPAHQIPQVYRTLRGFRETCRQQVNSAIVELLDRGVAVHGSARNLADDLGVNESSVRRLRQRYS